MIKGRIGTSPSPIDGLSKVCGTAEFVGDIRLPNMLVGKILRSPYAHARIISIRNERALRVPGIRAILTGQDFPKKYGVIVPDETALAVDVVRYIGDEVVAIAAETEEAADEALLFPEVEYEPLPTVFDPETAMQADAPLIHKHRSNNVVTEYHIKHGDIEAGFAKADCVIEQRFKTSIQHQCYIEPYGCIVSPEGGRLTVWGPFQDPFPLAETLAEFFGISVTQVRVIQTYIGGSFGGKTRGTKLPYIAALLAQKTGRPVRMINELTEEFTAGRPRIPVIADLKMGFRKDGKILSKKTRIVGDNGAYSSYAPSVFTAITIRHDNQYMIPNIQTDSYLVYTNKVPTSAFRGFGNISMIFAVESMMDMGACHLGIDPIELRLRNVVRAGDITPYRWKIQTNGLVDCLEAVRKRMTISNDQRKNGRGVGIACAIHSSSNRSMPFDGATARVRLNHDGSIHLVTGEPDGGQGSPTVFAQIIATELEIAFERVSVPRVDTDFSPFGLGFYADRLTLIGGHAVLGAARRLKEAILEAAASLLEIGKEHLEYREGSVCVIGYPEKRLMLGEIASRSFWRGRGQTLEVEYTYDPPTEQRDPQTLSGNTHPTHSFSAQGIEIEVDQNTGHIHVLKVVSAHDLGRTINPKAAEGQIEGAVAIGLGYALSEAYQFENGKPLTTTFDDYGILRAPDLPRIETVLVETNDPMGPFGAKGVGQTGTLLPAPAIANALANAVGVRLTELPMIPSRVLEGLQKKGGLKSINKEGPFMRKDLELLKGAIEYHVHSSPDVFPRLMDHVDLALHYKEFGFRAVVLKCHHMGTADRVPLIRKMVQGIDVFGSLSLNYAVGGLNPFAVDTALKYDAKVIWMPTVDSANHVKAFGTPGQFGSVISTGSKLPAFYEKATGISILDDKGNLKSEIRDILELIAQRNVILSCGHLDMKETVALVKAARAAGVKKIICEHPTLFFTFIPLDVQEELVKQGAYMNYTFSEISPQFHSISAKDMCNNIQRLGVSHVIISGDTGQPNNPLPAEAMRVMVQVLMNTGISQDDVRKMIQSNLAQLIYDEIG